MSRKLVGMGLEEAQVSNATRAVEEAPRMAVDRPQRFGFRAAVNAISVAALVNLIALAASAVRRQYRRPASSHRLPPRRSPSVTCPTLSWASVPSSSSSSAGYSPIVSSASGVALATRA